MLPRSVFNSFFILTCAYSRKVFWMSYAAFLLLYQRIAKNSKNAIPATNQNMIVGLVASMIALHTIGPKEQPASTPKSIVFAESE